jgi:hypothetical protein
MWIFWPGSDTRFCNAMAGTNTHPPTHTRCITMHYARL